MCVRLFRHLHYVGQVEGFLRIFWVNGVGRLSARNTTERFTDGPTQLLSRGFLKRIIKETTLKNLQKFTQHFVIIYSSSNNKTSMTFVCGTQNKIF